MQFVFLGTSGMVPTKTRNVSGYFLKFQNDGILFDCGEGTQRQMNLCGMKRTSITKIFITHWHADHIAGLSGLLHTMNNEMDEPSVMLFGPKGTKKRMKALFEAVDLTDNEWITINEINPKGVETCYETDTYTIECAPMTHSTPCIAYSFVEKDRVNVSKAKLKKLGLKDGPYLRKLKEGKDVTVQGKKVKAADVTTIKAGRKLTLITDTMLCDNCFHIAENADVLVCESTYHHDLLNKAKEYHHMTSREAASIASQSNVKKLYLTHFSQRYKDVTPLQEDAQMVFPETIAAEDLMKITL